MEYFQGGLFLTTNRKKDFDEAFKSRIHVTISYGDLSDDAQALIWERLIVTNKNAQVNGSWTAVVFEALGKLKFNVSTSFLSLRRFSIANRQHLHRAGQSRTSYELLLHSPTLKRKHLAFAMSWPFCRPN